MSKDKFTKKARYYVEYTQWERDLSVSYHCKYFNDYFAFVTFLHHLLCGDSYHITNVYKDFVCVG